MPYVSVIIPNYNHARFLESRIESVLGQTFTDFEVILLDDCSTDGSRAILEKYQGHPRVSHLVYNAANSGSTFRQWQLGIGMARGECIWIAESDDRAEPTFLERAVSRLGQPGVGLVFCQSRVVDEHNAEVSINLKRYREPWTKDLVMNGPEMLKTYFLKWNVIPNASAVLFRRALAVEALPALASFRYAGDWFFWAQMLPHTNVAFIKDELNFFRVHGRNVSGKAEKAGLTFIEGFRVIRTLAGLLPGLTPAEQTAVVNYWAKNLAGVQRNPGQRFPVPVLLLILKHSLQLSIVFPAKFAAYYSWGLARQLLGK